VTACKLVRDVATLVVIGFHQHSYGIARGCSSRMCRALFLHASVNYICEITHLILELIEWSSRNLMFLNRGNVSDD